MTVDETAVAAEVLRPGDEGYDESARAFLGAGAPALVVRPREPGAVAAALAHARDRGLAVSVRSGGHGVLGHATNTGGVVIDLRYLNAVDVLDEERRLVRVGGGAVWSSVAAALDPYDWGISSGDTTSVGVGGLTLGGGIGWMVRKHGLAIDSLVGARVVTADGRLVTASETENRELFWALRGGGGNFGVVVDFDFVAQQVGSVHYGNVAYRLDDAPRLIARWRDAMRGAVEELSSTLVLMPQTPAGPPAASVLFCYAGTPGTPAPMVDAAVERLFDLGEVTEGSISERRYAEVLEEAAHPPGVRVVGRSTLVPRLARSVIAAVAAAQRNALPTAFAIRALGGAVARVPSEATAFAHRDAEALVVAGLLVPPTATDAEVTAALGPWETVARHGAGPYLNFHGSSTDADIAAAYPPAHLARLAAVKRAYDPGNVFGLNHNVRPDAA